MTIDETIDALERMLMTIQVDDNYYYHYEVLNSALKHLERSRKYRSRMRKFRRMYFELKRKETLDNDTI